MADATATELAAENAALRELLEVYETTSVEQAQKLELALNALDENSKRLLAAERERSKLAEAQAERLEQELEIAAQIQTSILPRSCHVQGFDVAATMVPAERVGGDYFDVIPTNNGCWLGIGDVSGHGLTAGLIMLMTQSAVTALIKRDPTISPSEAIAVINEVLFENIRRRLRQDDHMTLTLLRLEAQGRLYFAGAHEDLMILRKGAQHVEQVRTPGTWVGAVPAIRDVTKESAAQLDEGDILVLYSDGITEARDPKTRTLFGTERLAGIILDSAGKPSSELCGDIFQGVRRWSPITSDDRTAVVVHRAA